MTLKEFNAKVKELNIPDNSYSLAGKLVEGFVFEKTDRNRWRVFHFERGNYTMEETFYIEENAYDYFFSLLEKLSDMRNAKDGRRR